MYTFFHEDVQARNTTVPYRTDHLFRTTTVSYPAVHEIQRLVAYVKWGLSRRGAYVGMGCLVVDVLHRPSIPGWFSWKGQPAPPSPWRVRTPKNDILEGGDMGDGTCENYCSCLARKIMNLLFIPVYIEDISRKNIQYHFISNYTYLHVYVYIYIYIFIKEYMRI